MNKQFEWGEMEDANYSKEGLTVLYVDGSPDLIQKFVEDLSYKIGFKVDWGYAGGIAHIDVLPETIPAVMPYVKNDNYLRQFVSLYDMDSEERKPYFQIFRKFEYFSEEYGSYDKKTKD